RCGAPALPISLLLTLLCPPRPTIFPYTTLFRSFTEENPVLKGTGFFHFRIIPPKTSVLSLLFCACRIVRHLSHSSLNLRRMMPYFPQTQRTPLVQGHSR